MVMRNLVKVGCALLVVGTLALSACGSSGNSPTGTGGRTGSGGNTGVMTGAGGADAGSDAATTGAGGSTGTGGAGGAAANARQDHLNIINKSTGGGLTVTRPAPVAYDTCKI